LDDALQIVERTGERWFAAELKRHKGQLLLRQGHSEAAEELYRKALSIAVEQEAKLWELRAAASLARLRCDQGRYTEARDLLAPVYGWFIEGFDTPDLKQAKGAARRTREAGLNSFDGIVRAGDRVGVRARCCDGGCARPPRRAGRRQLPDGRAGG
jgi:predicted ATPase